MVSFFVQIAKAIDSINDRFGEIAKWAIFLACLISAGNAIVRYAFDFSSNAFLEVQWYLFAACIMLGAAQVLRVNEHVRVDLLYSRLSGKGQALLDLAGILLFLAPVMVAMIYYSWPFFVKMYISHEMSSNAGGLIRWPAMLMLPLGFSLVLLQALSEVIKRVLWLNRLYNADFHYERPLQ